MTIEAERRAIPRPPREDRHLAREAALQMLYQWEVGGAPMSDVRQTFWDHESDDVPALSATLRGFAMELAEGASTKVADLDPLLAESAEHWRVERMNVVDRLILRLAAYELLHAPATPARVIINEALELARTFSGDEAVRFVNGVLDAVRRRLARE